MTKINYQREKSEKLDNLGKELHNVKQISYLNLFLLLILLAFLIGAIAKQLLP